MARVLKLSYHFIVMETAIVIRTKNEEKWIGVLLDKLFRQTYQDFEVIIVDNGSRDQTLAVARKFPVNIFEIPPKSFSYPYALNYGIARSQATRYLVIMSAHSIPVSDTWLVDSLKNFNLRQNVMGVDGSRRALPGATFWDLFFINGNTFLQLLLKGEKSRIISKPRAGVLAFTNAIIRKDLWDKKQFNEIYGAGGEDWEWMCFWFKQGYIVVRDPKCVVLHSHGLGLWGWIQQYRYWKSLSKPRPFQLLSFRKDSIHSPQI